MKILRYTIMVMGIVSAIISIANSKVPGMEGWIWQVTTIIWILACAVSSHMNDISDKIISSYAELTKHLFNRIEQLKEELRQTQIHGKSVTRKR